MFYKDIKNFGELRGDIGAIGQVFTPFFFSFFCKPFSQQKMHLKRTLLSCGLKLSSSKLSCGVSALHFFVKLMQPLAF
jgi:hypothetical protein